MSTPFLSLIPTQANFPTTNKKLVTFFHHFFSTWRIFRQGFVLRDEFRPSEI